MGHFSPVFVEGWMNQIARMKLYIGLCFSNPLAVSDPRTVEVTSDSYIRSLSYWTRTSISLMTLNDAIVINGLPPGAVVAAVAGWNSAVNGELVFADLLDEPISYPSGGTFSIAAGELVIGIDVI